MDEKKAATREKPKMALWKKIVGIVVVVIVALILVVNMATSGVVKVSNEFINDIQSQNTDAAYNLFSAGAKTVTSKDDLDKVIKKAGPILNTQEKMKSKEVSGETGKAGTGKVTYELTGTDSIKYLLTVNLVKDDGNWKVESFASTTEK